MRKDYEVTLPLPPPLNRQYRGAHGGGRLILSEESAAWKQAVSLYLNVVGGEPTTDRMAVSLTFYRPQRSGDIDGRIKITLDILQGHAYVNDSQVDELVVHNRVDRNDPRVEIRATRLPASHA